jgi:hypothetical protein
MVYVDRSAATTACFAALAMIGKALLSLLGPANGLDVILVTLGNHNSERAASLDTTLPLYHQSWSIDAADTGFAASGADSPSFRSK